MFIVIGIHLFYHCCSRYLQWRRVFLLQWNFPHMHPRHDVPQTFHKSKEFEVCSQITSTCLIYTAENHFDLIQLWRGSYITHGHPPVRQMQYAVITDDFDWPLKEIALSKIFNRSFGGGLRTQTRKCYLLNQPIIRNKWTVITSIIGPHTDEVHKKY